MIILIISIKSLSIQLHTLRTNASENNYTRKHYFKNVDVVDIVSNIPTSWTTFQKYLPIKSHKVHSRHAGDMEAALWVLQSRGKKLQWLGIPTSPLKDRLACINGSLDSYGSQAVQNCKLFLLKEKKYIYLFVYLFIY